MLNSERLNAIKSLVPNGTRLLDIGSDHALLPCELLERGLITHAVVTDINEGPLQSSRRKLSHLGAEKADFILSDGFAAVPQGGYDVAAVCGMGGELIARIIAEGGVKAQCPLILQPMTMYDRLRAFLWDNGYTIERELYPTEGRRTYLVMLVRYTSVTEEYSVADTYMGKLLPETDGYLRFVAAVSAAAANRLKGARHSGDEAAVERETAVIAAAERLLSSRGEQ